MAISRLSCPKTSASSAVCSEYVTAIRTRVLVVASATIDRPRLDAKPWSTPDRGPRSGIEQICAMRARPGAIRWNSTGPMTVS